jgi:hypothetical protein
VLFFIGLLVLAAFFMIFRGRIFDSATMRNLKPLVIFLVIIYIIVIVVAIASLLK